MGDIIDAMAITLAQACVDLADESATALLLLEAGYDEREIAHHRHEAANIATALRHVAEVCHGRQVSHG